MWGPGHSYVSNCHAFALSLILPLAVVLVMIGAQIERVIARRGKKGKHVFLPDYEALHLKSLRTGAGVVAVEEKI